jgi:hypothetical protein
MECSPQPNQISFSHWVVNPYTTIISNTPNYDYTFRTTTLTNFNSESNSGRGSAPYLISETNPNTSFCLSCNVRVISSLTTNSKLFTGICLLDEKYNKIFELSVGAWNTNVLDTFPLGLKRTTISNTQDVQLKLTYDSTPRSFTYIDENGTQVTNNIPSIKYHNGEQETTIHSQKNPKYIAIFMRGQGSYETRISNIKYNNLNTMSSPIPTPNNNFIRIDNATLNSRTLSRETTNDVTSCSVLCASDENCAAFEFNTQNECKLKDFSPSVSTFGSTTNSSLYLKEKSKVELLSDIINVKFSFTPKLSNVIVNRIHIKELIINSLEKPEFLIVTDDNKIISAFYTYCVIRSTNSPSPVGSSTGKLGLKFNIQLSASVTDVKSFYITTDNLNFDNVTIFNDRQVNAMNLQENRSVTMSKDNTSNQDYTSWWNNCNILNQVFMIKPFLNKTYGSWISGTFYFVKFISNTQLQTNINGTRTVNYTIDSYGNIQAPQLSITPNSDGNTISISGNTYYVDNSIGGNINTFNLYSNQIVINMNYARNIKSFGYKFVVYENDNTPTASFINVGNTSDSIVLSFTDNRIFGMNADQKNLIYGRSTIVPSFLKSQRTDLLQTTPYLNLDKDVFKALKSANNNTQKGNTVDLEWLTNEKFIDSTGNSLEFKPNNTLTINDYFNVKFYNYNGYIIFSDIYGTINVITTTNDSNRNKQLYRFIFPKFQFISSSTGFAPYGPYINSMVTINESKDYTFSNYRLRMNMKKRQVTINNDFTYSLNFVGFYADAILFNLLSQGQEIPLKYWKRTDRFELDYNQMLTFLWIYTNMPSTDIIPSLNIPKSYTNNETGCIQACNDLESCGYYSVNSQTNVCQLKLYTSSASNEFCFGSGSSNPPTCPPSSNTRLMAKTYGTYVPPNNKFIFT